MVKLPFNDLQNLPECTADFIRLVIRKMRYRKKVRADVMAELIAHFEDELASCGTAEEKDKKAQRLIDEFGDAKLLAKLCRRAKKRCRPLWRTVTVRIFQTIGILFLYLILYSVYVSFGKPNISTNYTMEMVNLNRPVVDESMNAAGLYEKAIDSFAEPPYINNGCQPSPMTPEMQQQAISADFIMSAKSKDWIEDFNDNQIAILNDWLVKNEESFKYFIQASQKPYCWWDKSEANNPPLSTLLLPELAPMRNISRMLIWQAKLKVYSGDIEGGFDHIITLLRAGEHLKGPRTLIEQLVGTAIQALAIENAKTILNNADINSQSLKKLQQKLLNLKSQSTYITDFQIEKFFMLDFIQRCYTDNGRGSGHLIPRMARKFYQELGENSNGNADFRRDYALYLALAIVSVDRAEIRQMVDKFYDTYTRNSHRTPWMLKTEKIDLGIGKSDWPKLKQARYFPVYNLTPALGKVIELSHRNRAGYDSLITIISIIRYGKDRGNYPESLQALLDSGYLKELPIDPYSDKSLVYKKMDDGFTLYSVGLNFKDDGGEFGRDRNGKPKSWSSEGDAVFWPVEK